MDLPVTVPLTRPVTLEGKTFSELVLDEPDLDCQIAYADLEAEIADLPKKQAGGKALKFWVSRLADVPEQVAGKIKGRDLEAVEATLAKIMALQGSGEREGGDAGNERPAK